MIAYDSTIFISESISEENNRHKSETLIHVEIKKIRKFRGKVAISILMIKQSA